MDDEKKEVFEFTEEELIEGLEEGESYYVDLIAKGDYEINHWKKHHEDTSGNSD